MPERGRQAVAQVRRDATELLTMNDERDSGLLIGGRTGRGVVRPENLRALLVFFGGQTRETNSHVLSHMYDFSCHFFFHTTYTNL